MTTPEIVLGPPGTGKTTELLRLVDLELDAGVPPDQVGFVTFTRRAAEEAISRACVKFRLERRALPYFRTLHSLCFRQLGLRREDVLEGARLREFAAYAGVRITGRWSDDGTLTGFDTGDRILFMENVARVRGRTLREQYDSDDDQLPWTEVLRVSKALAAFKSQKGLMDYTDMLHEFVQARLQLGLRAVFVDEAQDLSALQWAVVHQATQGCPRVVIAGDDDQAIYRWAGADADHLISMEGNARVLGQSYRVPPVIQGVAHQVISRLAHRRPKEWRARTGGEGVVGYVAGFGEVDCDAGEVLVLTRNAYVLREQVEPELRRQGIVYELNGHPSISTRLLETITDWERLRSGGEVPVERVRVIYEFMTSGRGVARGYKTLPKMSDEDLVTLEVLQARGGLLVDTIWHEALDRLPPGEVAYIVAARRRGERLRDRPRVRLSTIHGSKGGEAPHVVLLKEMAQRTYNEMVRGGEEDEMRVWYVGVTRAQERLTIVESSTARSCPWL